MPSKFCFWSGWQIKTDRCFKSLTSGENRIFSIVSNVKGSGKVSVYRETGETCPHRITSVVAGKGVSNGY